MYTNSKMHAMLCINFWWLALKILFYLIFVHARARGCFVFKCLDPGINKNVELIMQEEVSRLIFWMFTGFTIQSYEKVSYIRESYTRKAGRVSTLAREPNFLRKWKSRTASRWGSIEFAFNIQIIGLFFLINIQLIVYLMLVGSSRPYPWFILEENGR